MDKQHCDFCARTHDTHRDRLIAHHAGILADLAALDPREPDDARQTAHLRLLADAYVALIAEEQARPTEGRARPVTTGRRTLPVGIYTDGEREDRYRAIIYTGGRRIIVGRWFHAIEDARRARDAALAALEDTA